MLINGGSGGHFDGRTALVGRQDVAATVDRLVASDGLAEPDLLSPGDGVGLIGEGAGVAGLTVATDGDDELIDLTDENGFDNPPVGRSRAPE